MDWVKLRTNYYNDAAVMRAGDAAELLFVRAMAYCGDQESGVIPREVVPRLTPARGAARAAALVREGLWRIHPQGWEFVSWDRHQESSDQLAAKREAGKRRKAAYDARQRNQRGNAVGNAVTHASVTLPEVEEEEEVAAAAATPTPLPPQLEILKAKLDAHKLTVRWDRLTSEQHTEIAALIDLHGDAPLVKAAVAAYRPDSPAAFAQAWLPAWRQLVVPGTGLRAVSDPDCPLPGHSGTTRHCVQCASERLVEGNTR